MISIVDTVKVSGEIVDRVSHYKVKKDGTPYKRPSLVTAYCGEQRVKQCTKCNEWYAWDDFRIFSRTSDGKFPQCRGCEEAYFRVYDNTPKGQKRFERRKELEAGVIRTEPEYHAFVKDVFDNQCALTGESGDIVLDHAIPLAWGCVGNELGNLIPLSNKMNKVKRSRNIFEVAEGLGNEAIHRLHSIVLPFLAAENEMTVEEYTKFYYMMEEHKL